MHFLHKNFSMDGTCQLAIKYVQVCKENIAKFQ